MPTTMVSISKLISDVVLISVLVMRELIDQSILLNGESVPGYCKFCPLCLTNLAHCRHRLASFGSESIMFSTAVLLQPCTTHLFGIIR